MKLAPIQYKLEEYELPEECYADGVLTIEIDPVDENPYIYSFELSIANDVTSSAGQAAGSGTGSAIKWFNNAFGR